MKRSLLLLLCFCIHLQADDDVIIENYAPLALPHFFCISALNVDSLCRTWKCNQIKYSYREKYLNMGEVDFKALQKDMTSFNKQKKERIHKKNGCLYEHKTVILNDIDRVSYLMHSRDPLDMSPKISVSTSSR